MVAKYCTLGGTSAIPVTGPGYFLGLKGPSGFGASSTAEQVAQGWDGKGQVVLITGGSGGLGAKAAEVLAAQGATIIILARNVDSTQQRIAEIKQQHPSADLRVIKCDLESLPGVAAAAKEFLDMKLPLNILMCNAGIMACPFKLTEQKLELQFGVNHVAHALLVRCLLPHMIATARAPGAPIGRIIILSSTAHYPPAAPKEGILPLERINSDQGYKRWAAYSQSKLANALFARELAARLRESGAKEVVAACCHPGVIPTTDLTRHLMSHPISRMITGAIARPFFKNVSQGAATQVFLATCQPPFSGGEYYEDCNIGASSTQAHDAVLANRLWQMTEDILSPFIPEWANKDQPIPWNAPRPSVAAHAQ